MFEAFQQRVVKKGPSSNEGLKYRDIAIVKFESGPCCAHFLRGSIYILEPVCYAVTVAISKPIFTKKLSNHKTLSKLTCAVNTERPRIMWILVLQTNRVMQNLR